MKILHYTVVFLLLISLAILSCHRGQTITQKQLRSSVLIFKDKFLKAEEIEVFIHNPITAGEKFVEIRKYTLSRDQVAKLTTSIDFVLSNKLTHRESMPMTQAYDITIALKSLKNTELITISAHKREIIAHNTNPYPIPPELAMTLHDFFSNE
jgi:hypothetical protein